MANTRKSSSADLVHDAVVATLDGYHLDTGSVLVSFSGGLDSSVLLHAAHTAASQRGWGVRAIHFHHGLSLNADQWSMHCQAVCENLAIPCAIEHLNIRDGGDSAIEERARRSRYEILERADNDLIFLGHHAGDQAETVLFNLCRGAGILGLAGIPASRDRFRRPFIAIQREDLASYARNHGLVWCEDESNSDTHHTRNYFRHSILPALGERFPSVIQAIATSARHAAQAHDLLRDLAQLDAEGNALVFPFSVVPLRKLSLRRAENLLHTLISGCGLQAPPARRLSEFARQLATFDADRHPELRLGDDRIQYRSGYLHLHLHAQATETSDLS
jgi:tRNA(Ile)-lysidine synthase